MVITWLKKIYYFDPSMPLDESMEQFQKKLANYLYHSYTKIRIDQLFNIVIGETQTFYQINKLYNYPT